MHVEADPLLLPDHLYKCHLCEKKFKGKGEMKRHVLHVHEGKKYICKMCPLKIWKIWIWGTVYQFTWQNANKNLWQHYCKKTGKHWQNCDKIFK